MSRNEYSSEMSRNESLSISNKNPSRGFLTKQKKISVVDFRKKTTFFFRCTLGKKNIREKKMNETPVEDFPFHPQVDVLVRGVRLLAGDEQPHQTPAKLPPLYSMKNN